MKTKLRKVGIANQEIDVIKYEIIEDSYNGRSFKTIIVNDSIKLNYKDKITYVCNKCGIEKTENFFRKDKFIQETFICNVCERKATSLKRYGTEFPVQNKEVFNKVKETKKKRYGNEKYNNSEKAKKTNINKFGTTSPLANNKIRKKIKQTNLERYGNEVPNCFGSDEFKQSMIDKYGVESTMQSDELKKQVKQTNLERYGNEVPNCFGSDEFKQSMIDKYGVENARQSGEINDKIKFTIFKNTYEKIIKNLSHIVKPLFSLNDYNGVERSNKYLWVCSICGDKFEDHLHSHIPRCLNCNPHITGFSKYEKEIADYIKSLDIENVKENDRTILNGKELDIYLPDYNLAIEYNGLYWHGELMGKDRNYHLNKTLKCKEKNIQLLHIFEDEWLDKQNIIKNIIKIKLGLIDNKIYARKCVIKELKSNECKDFLNNNHMQGYIAAKVNLGLYYEDGLVSLLTFGKSRYNKKYDWEILRYVNKSGVSITGGFAKLLKYFKNNYSGSIVTYSDRRLFNGNVYENNGFTKLKPSSPNYYYTEGKLKRYSRIQFQKHKLKDKLDIFDPEMTEWQNMQMNGWDRIWDCGNNVFEDKIERG